MTSNEFTSFTIEQRLSQETGCSVNIFDVKKVIIPFIKTNAIQYNVETTKTANLSCSSSGQMAVLIESAKTIAFSKIDT